MAWSIRLLDSLGGLQIDPSYFNIAISTLAHPKKDLKIFLTIGVSAQ
ncbi:MAG: hypothetical protein ACFFC7_25970 [Candidatus Hermodarchaeota archaeon]